jgi:hypothetical protein
VVPRRGDGQGTDDNRVTAAATASDVSRRNRWTNHRLRIASALSYAILLGGILTIGAAAYMVVISYSGLPYSDGWTEIFPVAAGVKLLSFTWLWQQHNEHRLFIPKLFLIADLRLIHANQVFLLASIFAVQLLHLLLLSLSMRVLGGWRGTVWRTGVGLAAFCLFCPSQWENLVWGFQTCFVLPGLFATLSYVGLLLYWIRLQTASGRRRRWKFLVLSILAALGATYSLANGSILWPLLVVASLLLRLRPLAVLSFAIAGTVSTALYFHGYFRPLQHASPISSARAPAKVFEYLAIYLGSPWVHEYDRSAIFFGTAGLVLALCAVLRFRSYVQGSSAFSVQLVLTLAFCLGTALITALGRVNLGLMQAFSSRYQTVALLFWCCLGLLLVAASAKRTVFAKVVQLVLFAVLVRGATLARFPMRQARWHGFQLNSAAAALLAGVNDTTQLQLAYPQPDYIIDVLPYMREKRLSVFSAPLASQLGKPLDALFRVVASDSCTGAVQSVITTGARGSQGLRITGWAWDYENRRPPAAVIATAEGAIAGLGAMGDWRPTIRATRPWMNTSFIGFDVYARSMPESAPVKLYAILRGRTPTACYFAALGVPERADQPGDGKGK